jgi:hypothetical protein
MGRGRTDLLTVFGRRLLPLRGIPTVGIAVSQNVTEPKQKVLVSDAQTSCHRTPCAKVKLKEELKIRSEERKAARHFVQRGLWP